MSKLAYALAGLVLWGAGIGAGIGIYKYHSKPKPTKIETLKVDDYEGSFVTPQGYFIGVSETNELEIRNIKSMSDPFRLTETKRFDSDGDLVGLEKKMEVVGLPVNVSLPRNVTPTSFKLRKRN